MKLFRYQLLFFALSLGILNIANGQVSVALNHNDIEYNGSFYNLVSDSVVVFNRHDSEVYNHLESGIYGSWIRQWVITQTGVRIRFKTSSPTIRMEFRKRTDGGSIGASPSNGFTVYADSVHLSNYSSLDFTINNPNQVSTIFEVSLPNLWAVDFIGMELENGFDLDELENHNQPVYVSIGNSITHGTGQYVSSAKTYPFVLSRLMGWNLHNFAVAGATTGWAMGLNGKNEEVDYFTVLLGFNDWKYSNSSLVSIKNQYEELIDELRTNHPDAEIFCITPLTSTDQSGAAPYSLHEMRVMIEELITDKMELDDNLYLVPGPSISNSSMLAPGDPVHLSESGAQTLAENLFENLKNPDSIVLGSNDELKFNQMDIKFIGEKKIILDSGESGNYLIELCNIAGQTTHSQVANLEKGENHLRWNIPFEKNNLCIVRISINKNIIKNELKYIQ